MLKTKNQSKVSISGLTYNNLLEDAYNALRDSDAFKNNFTDFTSNTAERMIVELYAYVATQLANRLDQMGNELFVDTASASGMSRLLKLVGAKVDFPSAAGVKVDVTTSSNTDVVSFTTGIDSNGSKELNYVTGSFKSVTANNGTTWEFINRVVGEGGEYVYDYTTPYVFTAPNTTFTVYEGTTNALEYTVRSTDIGIVTLSGYPVVKDSVRVYYKQKVLKAGTTDTYEISEFKKVDNFFTTEALTAKVGVFTERNMGNGKCEICLKPYSNDSENDLGKELLIMYRTGGGEDGNIAIGAIDKTERFGITDSNGRITSYGLLNIRNSSTGSGGKDELTTDEIRATVLQEVRNTKIAITEEDYEYLLPKYDSEIELIKCYGEKNSETAALAETYGYYINPITVWLIILKYNKEFYDAYFDDVEGLTSRINDIAFSTLDINPRFNEKYQVNKAFLNQVYREGELKQYFNSENNTYSFPIDPDGVEILSGGSAKITVTNYPYIESGSAARRGVNCFDRYNSITEPATLTWSALLGISSASKDDVHIVTDSDLYGEVNNRWKCKQSYSNIVLTEENVEEYWGKVDFQYIYDNFVSDNIASDIKYIQQNASNTSFNPVYSNIDHSFSGLWSDLRAAEGWAYGENGVKVPAGDSIFLTINGIQIEIPGGKEFADAQAFCDFINAKIAAETQIIMLKQNVTGSISEQPDSVTLPGTGIASSTFTLSTGGTDTDVTVSISGTTYGDLLDDLNDVLPSNYRAVWIENNNCWNLGLICSTQFTYADKSSSLSDDTALYVNVLDHADFDEFPLRSGSFSLTASQANEFADYLSTQSGGPLVTVVDGKIVFGFNSDGECSILVSSTSADKEEVFKNFLGIPVSSEEAVTKLNRRTVTVIYSPANTEDETGSAYLQIAMLSEEDSLSGDIYINIFGGLNGRIRLGEYYENIDKYLPNVSSVITDLLRRGPISHLYSTSYISDDFNTATDVYGSDYQLKFSTGLIEEQTFNQLSSGNSPASITTMRTATTSTPSYSEGNKLYMKIDNIEYDGTGTFTVHKTEASPGVTYTVPESSGYAEFDLSWFNSCTTDEFVNGIVSTFSYQGPVDPETGENTPLIQKTNTAENTLTIYTLSSAFYSSIDFGATLTTTISDLFGIESPVVKSAEGQIDVQQIGYKYYPFTGSLAIGNIINIVVDPASGDEVSDNINIGYSLVDFTNNVANSNVGNYVTVNNNRIILTDLNNGSRIKLTVAWEDNVHKLSWQNMFTANIWNQFTIEESGDSGEAYLEFVNDGDYYIEMVPEGESSNYYLVVQNQDAFPLGDIYFHMYEDYSNDHIVRVDDNGVVYTDEYNWNNLMTDRKVMLTEHVYKQPRFIPFDLAITCYLPNTETYNKDYQKSISNYLRTEYGLYSDNIGEEILPDDIVFNIKENFPKIIKVTVDYLGYNMSNSATNKESLTTEFNQKHILASTELTTGQVVDPITGFITVQDNIVVHGLKITLKYRAS